MKLSVNPNDKMPIYRQLYEQIAAEVLNGSLRPGDPLPPIRTVSRELGVSMITVRSAWDMLIHDGYLVARTGSGCFVAPISQTNLDSIRSEKLSASVDALVAEAKSLGISPSALCALIEQRYESRL